MHEELLSGVAPDPLALARALLDRQYVSLLWGKNGSLAYLACDPVEHSHALDPEPSLPLGARSALHAVPRWLGLLPYECRRGLERGGYGSARVAPHVTQPHWVRYPAVAEVSADGVRVIGESVEAVRELATHLRAPARAASAVELAAQHPFEDPELHRVRIRRALEHIRAGDLYQVNLARRFDFRVLGEPWDVLARLAASRFDATLCHRIDYP